MLELDHIEADRFSPLDLPVLVVDARHHRKATVPVQAVIIGIDPQGMLPTIDESAFDVLLTTSAGSGAPWISVAPGRLATALARLVAAIEANPVAASTLARTLRMAELLPVEEALIAESHAYSMLLGGREFRHWHTARPCSAGSLPSARPVRVDRDRDHVTIALDTPSNRNAMTARMRDELYAALVACLDDPTGPTVTLVASGRCFSTGGELAEFGTSGDLAAAHVVRTLHSCARAVFALGDRIEVRLHGACVGSGLEIAAAASRRTATIDSWFQLPEVRMGLIPGAGGTVSVARAIGRHRTCWMALTGARVTAPQALEWGMVHGICGPT